MLVRLRDQNLDVGSLAHRHQAKVLHRFEGEFLHLELPSGQGVEDAVEEFSQDEAVAYAVPNHLYHRLQPSPGEADELWGLTKIEAPLAWQHHKGRRDGPIVAVLDTGLDTDHTDLVGNLWTNSDEIPGDGIDNDGNGIVDDVHGYFPAHNSGDPKSFDPHGTHCAGTIGAEGGNDHGIVGVNWKTQLMGIRLFDDDDNTDVATIIRGLDYAESQGVRITSNSWGGFHYNRALEEALATSSALHIVAAGNYSSDNDLKPNYPGSYPLDNVVTVAASDRQDRLASFSNFGPASVDLAAPGVDILSTVPFDRIATFSGTSMACPHVTGVAALIASYYPDIDNASLRARLLNSVDRVAALEGKVATGGRLNAARALAQDLVAPAPVNDFRGQATPFQIELHWTATGDDGRQGQASRYRLLGATDAQFSEPFLVECG